VTLRIERDHSLKALNSFGLEQRARFYAEAHDDADVAAAAAFAVAEGLALMPLGGGSNLLLTRDIDALVLRLANRRTANPAGGLRRRDRGGRGR